MRATFLDPQGRWLVRVARFVALLALIVVFFFFVLTPLHPLTITAISLIFIVDLLPLRQQQSRQVEIVCGLGFVDVKKAGIRLRRIRAKSIVGAATARTSRGVLLTFSLSGLLGYDEPTSIEVERDADADRIRQSLGINHRGFGFVIFNTGRGIKENLVVFLAVFIIGMFIGVVGFIAIVREKVNFGVIDKSDFFPFVSILSFLAWVSPHFKQNAIIMGTQGLRIPTWLEPRDIPYACVRDIERGKDRVLVLTSMPNLPQVVVRAAGTWHGLSDESMRNFKSQVMSAVDRANGLDPKKEVVGARLEFLRRNGQSPRAWLSRLDTVGLVLSSSEGDYRSQFINTVDLWTVLEDPDADIEIRTAAARVLRHSQEPGARVRIDNAVAAVRDDTQATNPLRIVMEDDPTSSELVMLEVIDVCHPRSA
ncbi:MAG: hypothetical protein FWD69_05375 [Polyangiaceae bacterium]|nr:hypothetical protein [Polyangiaceae bacterium]